MMRFLITTLFALSLFVGSMNLSAPMALAQPPCVDDAGNPCEEALAPVSTTNSDDVAPAPAPSTNSDNKVTPLELGDNSGMMIFIMRLFAWLLGIAAVTLDAAVYHTVLTMGDYIKNLSAIGITWTILRDIGNIALIFGFLLAGINIILGTHFYGEGQKLIPILIIVAVSLNFSLFVAEAVIDTGNLFATQIYTAINKGEQAGLLTNNLINNPTEAGSQGVGGIIMAQMGLQTIYGDAMTNSAIFEEGTPAGIAFMAIILFLVTAFVLFSLAFILIARFVILILVIITSPIGFIGYAIPPMKAKANLWWHTLFSQTITAPVLMLSLYVALSVITAPTFFSGFTTDGAATVDGTIATWTKLVTDPAGFGGMALTFLVAMGLLLAVNMIAKDLSAFGASTAMKWAGRASFGASAYAMSGAIGGTSGLFRRGMQRLAPNPDSAVVRGLSRASRFVENRTFDVRNAPLLGAKIGAGLSAGGSSEAAEGVGGSTVGRIGQGVHAYQHATEASRRQTDQDLRVPRLRQAVADGNRAEVVRLVGRMSNAELESHNVAHMVAHDQFLASTLPQNRFDQLMQSEAISENEKETMRQARNLGVTAQFVHAPSTNPDPRAAGRTEADVTLNGLPEIPAGPGGVPPRVPPVPGLSTAQRAELPNDVLAQPNVMAILNPADFAAIARRGALDRATQVAMSTYVQAVARGTAIADPRAPQLAALLGLNPQFASYFA